MYCSELITESIESTFKWQIKNLSYLKSYPDFVIKSEDIKIISDQLNVTWSVNVLRCQTSGQLFLTFSVRDLNNWKYSKYVLKYKISHEETYSETLVIAGKKKKMDDGQNVFGKRILKLDVDSDEILLDLSCSVEVLRQQNSFISDTPSKSDFNQVFGETSDATSPIKDSENAKPSEITGNKTVIKDKNSLTDNISNKSADEAVELIEESPNKASTVINDLLIKHRQ